MTDQTTVNATAVPDHGASYNLPNQLVENPSRRYQYQNVIDEICELNWQQLDRENLINVAWAYYHFSVQFRESLEIACSLHPEDKLLQELDQGERNTDNLSPWPGVANPGERMHHDEFMRRTLLLSPIDESRKRHLKYLGGSYLAKTRGTDLFIRATSLASYEDGGLEKVFGAMLTAPDWDDVLLRAFRHFLIEHIKFDSDPDHGHGAICRHLAPDDKVLPLWSAFKEMLTAAAPRLAQPV
jgi:hypothetical protein